MICADHSLKHSPPGQRHALTQYQQHRSHEKHQGKYAINLHESEIELSRNKISVPSSNKVHNSNGKLDSRSGPLKNKR